MSIVGFADTGQVSSLLKPSLRGLTPARGLVIAETLLSWIYGQATLRKAHPSKKDFRPMRIPAGRSRHEDLMGFIGNNPATAELFDLTSNIIKLSDGLKTMEKIEIEDYVLAHFDANKLLMV